MRSAIDLYSKQFNFLVEIKAMIDADYNNDEEIDGNDDDAQMDDGINNDNNDDMDVKIEARDTHEV